jgi:Coenzyme PQQ synthesis protein D (PqqD)
MKPRRRREALVVHELPEEVLVYDLERHKAFCLTKNIAWIWRHCTGRRTPEQIAHALEAEIGAPVGEDVVRVALHRLGKVRLLREPITSPAGGARSSRRELLKRAAMLGGLTIFAISAPTVGQAATCRPAGVCVNNHCTDAQGRTCCSNNCKQNSAVCGTGQFGFQCL